MHTPSASATVAARAPRTPRAPACASRARPAVERCGTEAGLSAGADEGVRAGVAVDWTALVAERTQLVRFARRRLLDPSLAEDLVHDVFEAVVSGRARFDGRASLRTWLTAILKHKIIDLVRARSGFVSLDHEAGEGDERDEESAAARLQCPQPQPDEVAAQRELLRHALARVRALPQTLRLAFERRVLADEDSASVCATLGISENNLFVRLHRARALLAA